MLRILSALLTICNDTHCDVKYNDHNYILSKEIQTPTTIIQGNQIISSTSLELTQRYNTIRGSKYLATASIQNNHIVHGIFVTENGIVEINENQPYAFKINETTDIYFNNPENLPFKSTIFSNLKINSVFGKIDKWNPGCFPLDTLTHVLQIELIIDLALSDYLFEKYSTKSRVIDAINENFGFGKLVYLEQFNVRVEVTKIKLSIESDPPPLSNRGSACKNALGTFDDFTQWNVATKNYQNTSYIMLLSYCFNGITGVSNIGAVCGTYSAVGVSIFSWTTIFHELGHALGADHSFENGMGTTGGLMDYGDGMYNGVVQFHPRQYTRICPYLTGLKTWKCKYFFPVLPDSQCGDGILSPDEQCECLDNSQNCVCKNCKLSPNIECSTNKFIMRHNNTPNFVVVSPKELSHPTCCRNNKLTRPKLFCDNNNICGANGKCIPFCNKIISWASKPCGFDSTGCILSCTDDYGNCRTKWTSDSIQINILPEGSLCQNNTIGKCDKLGNCIVSYIKNCSIYSRKTTCIKNKCKWRNNKCL
mgnify:FL=1